MLLQARTGASARERPGPARWSFGASAETWILAGLVVLAAVLRFATISSQSYWLDESQAAHELGLSFGAMLRAWNVAEWNPPLYLIVAWPWAKVFGTSAAGLRSLSALLGVGLVPLLYLCGRELVSGRAGLVAAALAAVNPFMIWYSQEAREYMLLLVLCTASMLFFARAWRSGSSRDLVWWAVFSALALLTQYFAGFLVAAEGLLLVYRLRSRASVLALGTQALVLAPLIPHVIPRFGQKAAFITDQGLATRIQQVPVTFGLNTLFKSPSVSYGLLGAAALAAIVIALLIIGADDRQLRGAGLAAILAGAVLLIPLGLALTGHDDYLARGLMPAWPPLAIVIGAACTAPGAKLPGAALVGVLVAAFLWAGFKINSDAYYQRPDWRGVAVALGSHTGTRAIVAYDGQFATGPLSVYLPGVTWSGPGEPPGTDSGPVTIDELDIVGDRGQQPGPLFGGIRRISGRDVDGYLVYRFKLPHPWSTDPAQIQARAQRLLPDGLGAPPIIQRTTA
ncbi:MAG: glycosyltransferase family 39 protein [Solirubrobacteraceae bacterium]